MPFPRPTLSDLRQQAAADIISQLPGGDGLMRFSNLKVTADVMAGFTNLHYGYLDWIAKQSVPWTAEGEFLEGWAALKSIYRRTPKPAHGKVTFTGVNDTDLPVASIIVRSDGVSYQTITTETVTGGYVTVTVAALENGLHTNTPVGSVMTLGTAIAGINSNGTVSTIITGGVDTESDESERARMLQAYQNPPQGGSRADYERWALEVDGVTRAWCKPNWQGNGTVGILFMMDEVEADYGGFPQGIDGVASDETRDIAAEGDQLTVADHIFPLQPVTALVYAVAPTANPINFRILNVPVDLRSSVEQAIAALFLREGEPGGTIPLAAVEASLVAIPGLDQFIVATPSGDITNPPGNLPVNGTFTWV